MFLSGLRVGHGLLYLTLVNTHTPTTATWVEAADDPVLAGSADGNEGLVGARTWGKPGAGVSSLVGWVKPVWRVAGKGVLTMLCCNVPHTFQCFSF